MEGSSSKGKKRIGTPRTMPADEYESSIDEPMEEFNIAMRSEEDEDLTLEEECVANTFDPIPFLGGRWDAKSYAHHIKIQVVNQSADELELDFDLVNVEAPIANALRRILIAEVPTMAIEKVFLYQNTSCIQDEVLCHRLGLLPIYADPSKFAFPPRNTGPSQNQYPTMEYLDEEPPGDPKRNLVFELHSICPSQKDERLPKRLSTGRGATTSSVGSNHIKGPNENGNWVLYSKAFKWIPIGDQKEHLESDPPRLVHEDIILAKMRPGQEIEARCHCVKGIGRDHAKFSPVATATYRMLPQIKLNRDDFDEDQATRLQASFSQGVIGQDERTGKLFVKNARADTSSRNIFQHEDLKDAVEMTKKKTHFIFSVESTGAMPAHQLVMEACEIMKDKLDRLRRNVTISNANKGQQRI